MATLIQWDSGTLPPVVKQNDAGDATVASGGGFPASWIEFDQDENNNIAANFQIGAAVTRFTCRFYFRCPPVWADGSALIAALQDSGGFSFPGRVVMSGASRPGVARLSVFGSDLFPSTTRMLREGRWHRFEVQFDGTGPVPAMRARAWRTGSNIRVWDTSLLMDEGLPGDVTGIRLGAHQDLSDSGQGQFAIAHVLAVDEITDLGRHATDLVTDPVTQFSVWDGQALAPATAVGVWDGTQVVPLQEATSL